MIFYGKKIPDVAVYTTGSLARQLVGFIMLPIYTQYLAPSDYGIVALLTVMISIFEIAIGARFGQAIPKFYFETNKKSDRNVLVSTALMITSVISSLAICLIVIFSDQLSVALLGNSKYALYVSILSVTLLTTAIENYGLSYIRLQSKPLLFIILSLSKLFVQLSLNILFVVYYDMGVSGVIYSSVISSTIFFIILGLYILNDCGVRLDITIAKKLVLFSWPLWIAGIAALYIGSSSRFFIKWYSGLTDVGLFELATKFSSILMVLVWGPFMLWWQVERFKEFNKSNRNMGLFQGVFIIIVSLLILVIVIINLFSQDVIRLMSSESFHLAGSAVTPLSFAILFTSLSVFFNFSFLISGQTLKIAYLKWGQAILLTVFYTYLVYKFSFVGAAYGALLSNVIVFYITYFMSLKYFNMKVNMYIFHGILVFGVIVSYLDNFIISTDSNITLYAIKFSLVLSYLLFIVVTLYSYEPTKKLLINAFKHKT